MRRRKIFKNEEEQSVSFFTNATWTRYGHSNISLPEDFYFRKKTHGREKANFFEDMVLCESRCNSDSDLGSNKTLQKMMFSLVCDNLASF